MSALKSWSCFAFVSHYVLWCGTQWNGWSREYVLLMNGCHVSFEACLFDVCVCVCVCVCVLLFRNSSNFFSPSNIHAICWTLKFAVKYFNGSTSLVQSKFMLYIQICSLELDWGNSSQEAVISEFLLYDSYYYLLWYIYIHIQICNLVHEIVHRRWFLSKSRFGLICS